MVRVPRYCTFAPRKKLSEEALLLLAPRRAAHPHPHAALRGGGPPARGAALAAARGAVDTAAHYQRLVGRRVDGKLGVPHGRAPKSRALLARGLVEETDLGVHMSVQTVSVGVAVS